ncbi:hypothetical protein [Rickettsiella endosymbiont of Dermanyssus gallinae]|uniref:hypothetical protein n=1 Tax=Rickettsiella endosymbiont of Dermanyssus gallinae TaxID=2856608 RepID=UPI001C52CA29|nr:hypothetical protein [Rickettsiella endosymbiont of Dermanyssus gallinae]
MKTKSKILTCLGAMALATVAILPSSAMAAQGYNETYNYTKHWGSFKDMNNQYAKAAGE